MCLPLHQIQAEVPGSVPEGRQQAALGWAALSGLQVHSVAWISDPELAGYSDEALVSTPSKWNEVACSSLVTVCFVFF